MPRRHASAAIDDVAAAWVSRQDRAALPPREQAEFEAWLAADARHLGAYARARAVFAHFDRAGALGSQYDPAQFAGRLPARQLSRRRFLWAAGIAVAAGGLGLVALREPGRRVATSLGEVLRLPLPDGSSVTLNSASEVAIEMGRAGRLVRLLRGEALFDVALDALRPFVVEAVRTRVLASGTSFTVQRAQDDAVEVLVRQGAVDLLDASVDGSLRLAANTLARVSPGHSVQVEPMRPIEVSRRLSWRDGMLSFDGDTLAEAAAQFGRYSALRLVIDDAETANRRVVGLYAASDPAGFAQAVALSMGLRSERVGGAVHLGRMDVQTSKHRKDVTAK